MKYSKKQLVGLINSVEAWIDKYEGESDTYGIIGCPLCELFRNDNCEYCSVYLKTDERYCHGTPYDRGNEVWWRKEATKTDKLKEVRFLISLLPKVNQRKYKKYMLKRKKKNANRKTEA